MTFLAYNFTMENTQVNISFGHRIFICEHIFSGYFYLFFHPNMNGRYSLEVLLMSTVNALINARAYIRIITYHRERGGHLLEASQLTF